jgi:hypothetical protein
MPPSDCSALGEFAPLVAPSKQTSKTRSPCSLSSFPLCLPTPPSPTGTPITGGGQTPSRSPSCHGAKFRLLDSPAPCTTRLASSSHLARLIPLSKHKVTARGCSCRPWLYFRLTEVAGRSGRGRNDGTWQDGCVGGNLKSDPTRQCAKKKSTQATPPPVRVPNKNQPNSIRGYVVHKRGSLACDMALSCSVGHSRVCVGGGDFLPCFPSIPSQSLTLLLGLWQPQSLSSCRACVPR